MFEKLPVNRPLHGGERFRMPMQEHLQRRLGRGQSAVAACRKPQARGQKPAQAVEGQVVIRFQLFATVLSGFPDQNVQEAGEVVLDA